MFAWVVYGLATWPCPKVEGRRYVCSSHHWPLRWPSTNDERDGPLLIPFDSGLSTHSKPLGHHFSNQKMVLNLVCCFPQCCVVTWNMVLKCLWHCAACPNIKPREVSRRSARVPRKRPITANHCITISGCSASNQRPTEKAGNGMVLFPSLLGCNMNMALKSLCTWVVGVTQWGVVFCLLQHKTKGVLRRSARVPLKKVEKSKPLHQNFRLFSKQPTTDKKGW